MEKKVPVQKPLREKELSAIEEMLNLLETNNELACYENPDCNCYAVAGVRG